MTHYLARKKPRQLHIVDDTALAAEFSEKPENRSDLSTADRGENRSDLSTGAEPENRTDLSTRLKRLSARRAQSGVSVARLLAFADVSRHAYFEALNGSSNIRLSTLERLEGALRQLTGSEKPKEKRSLCEITIRFLTAHLAREIGADVDKVLATSFEAENTNDPDWLQASRLRRAAIYVVVEGAGVSKADVGNALGISRQAVHKSVAVVELERDKNEDFDRMMRAALVQMAGWQ